MIGISELHASSAVAESRLFGEVASHRPVYHCGAHCIGQVILVDRGQCALYGIGDEALEGRNWGHDILEEGSVHMLWWQVRPIFRCFVNMCLGSHSAAERIRQLRAAMSSLRLSRDRATAGGDISLEFLFEGDLNFTNAPEHQISSTIGGTWYPGRPTMEAWQEFWKQCMMHMWSNNHNLLGAAFVQMGIGQRTTAEKVLDVGGISIDTMRYVCVNAVITGVKEIHVYHASDHLPVLITCTDVGPPKPKRQRGAPRLPYIPEWLCLCEQ